MEKNLTPADIAAVTNNNDGFGGNNAWWLILFMMFAFGNGSWGNYGGNWGYNNNIDNRFLERDIFATNQNVSNSGFATNQNVSNSAFATNQNVSNSACQTQRDVLENRYQNQLGLQNLEQTVNNCCMQNQTQILNNKYELDREILQNRYENSLQTQTLSAQLAQCCCDIKTVTHQEGEATRAMLTQNIIDGLRDQLANEQRANLANSIIANNSAQTQTLIGTLLPRPMPAYPSASPYMSTGWNSNGCSNCAYNNI